MASQMSFLFALLDTGDDAQFAEDIESWMASSPERKALVMQALYAALSYTVYDSQDAASMVGHALGKAVWDNAPGVPALRQEMLGQLREQFTRLRQLGQGGS